MVKYRRLEEPDNDLTYAEEFQQTHGEEPAANPEEETFKKRYGDLRRHSQQLMQQKDQELASLKRNLILQPKAESDFQRRMMRLNSGLRNILMLLK